MRGDETAAVERSRSIGDTAMIGATVIGSAWMIFRVLQAGARYVQHHKVLLMPDLIETLGPVIAASKGHQYVGAWSRIGLYHPGPAWFYWAAPFVRVFGPDPSVLFLAALALVAVSIVTIVLLVYRAEGWRNAAVTTLVLAWCIGQLSVAGLSYPWNPTVLILPTAVGLVAVASACAHGSRLVAAIGVLAGTFVAQADLGALPLGAAIVVASLVAAVVHFHRSGWGTRQRVAAVALVVVAIVPWVPVLYDQVAGSGNLGAVSTYVVTGKVDERFPAKPPSGVTSYSIPQTVSVFASITSLTLPRTAAWGGANFKSEAKFRPEPMAVVVLFALLAVVCFAALPRKGRFAGLPMMSQWLAWLSRAGLAAAAIEYLSLVRVRGSFRSYFVAASMGVGVALWLSSALTITTLITRVVASRSVTARMAAQVTAAVICLGSVVFLSSRPAFQGGPGLPSPIEIDNPVIQALQLGAPLGMTFRADDDRAVDAQMGVAALLSDLGSPPRVEGRYVEYFSDYNRDARGGPLVVFHAPDDHPQACEPLGSYRGWAICIKTDS